MKSTVKTAKEKKYLKLACYREVDHFINLLRNRPDRRGTVVESIDFTDCKALPMDPVTALNMGRPITANTMNL